VYIPHTTAGVTINEAADPAVVRDIKMMLNKLVPARGDYTHMEGNSDAHIKASLMGSSVHVPINSGKLALGTWQGIFFCEFDGPRTRSVSIQVIGK
jgi:secondary thiamine-phosphate synthase enzyme